MIKNYKLAKITVAMVIISKDPLILIAHVNRPAKEEGYAHARPLKRNLYVLCQRRRGSKGLYVYIGMTRPLVGMFIGDHISIGTITRKYVGN